MQKGMTYIVRPRIEPRKSSVMVAFISAGSIQLLVGPASSGRCEQMKVRSSTRATSLGSEVAQKEFGFDLSCTNVPASTSSWLIRAASSSDPSTHTTRSGVVSSATSRTKDSTPVCVVGAVSSPGMATAVISTPDFRRQMSPHRERRCSGAGFIACGRMASHTGWRTGVRVLGFFESNRMTGR